MVTEREAGHSGEEFYIDAPELTRFVAEVRAECGRTPDVAERVERLKAAFGELLGASGWLPPEFAQPFAASGMGGGIGQYLLYRSQEPTLTLFSLVVPSRSSTPVHDHLAWGLVGLYQGEQREEVYALTGGDPDAGDAQLHLTEERRLRAGEFYTLLPPTDDIHRVTTTSAEDSISIHLLGNDAGCVLRHTYEPDAGRSTSFRSGYSNVPCQEDE